MILGIDVWEGSLEINEPLLLENGVRFAIPRLNDMNGGHHLDENFYSQWDEARGFLRAPYFVYNPWVSGECNTDWLFDFIPDDTPPRIFCDIEVRYLNYPAEEYARQVADFIAILQSNGLQPCIYTGGWFLPYLSRWPSNVPYWWARYPYDLYPPVATPITWQDLSAKIELVGWYPDPAGVCPGTVKLWQCSADRYIPTGTLRTMDINAWNGTLAELEDWWGAKFPQELPEPVEQPDNVLRLEALVDGQNVRSGPGYNYPIIGNLTVGQVLDVSNVKGYDAWAEIAPGKWAAIYASGRQFLKKV